MTTKPAILRRFDKAKEAKAKVEPVLKKAYALAVPSYSWAGEEPKPCHTSEPAQAVMEAAARLHNDLFPPLSQWVDFAPGGDLANLAPAQEEQFSAWKKELVADLTSAIERSNFHTEIYSALVEAQISIGCIQIEEGEDRTQPLHFEAIPTHSLYIERGARGKITASFRTFSLLLREIEEIWPDAQIPEEIRQKKDAETQTFELIEALDGLDYSVWYKEECLVERKYRSNPRIIFSLTRVAGEIWPRGPVINALGDIGSADKLRELVLKHTALSVIGAYQAESDGVINFDNLTLQPLSVVMIAQGSQGLRPITSPGNISVAEYLDQKLAPSIARTIKGPELPPVDTRAMSATEAAMRGQEQAAFSTPTNLRLLDECFMPIVERMLEVLSGPKLGIVEPFKLDGRTVKAVPVSPLAKRWKEVRAGQMLGVFSQVGQMLGPEIAKVVNMSRFAKWYLEEMGFPPDLLVSEAEAQAQAQAQAQQAQAQQMMQAAPALNQLAQAGATIGQMGEGE